MTETMLPATIQSTPEKRQLALLKAVGLDKVQPEQRELALAIADRYDLDLMLGHLVLIEGKPYVTHRGLLHVAHRSGVFDGLEATKAVLEGGFWHSTASVWRRDMGRAFTVPGRYPEKGRNGAYAPEMAMVRAECLALRRAFDVAAPVAEERYAQDVERDLEAAAAHASSPRPSLAQLAAEKAGVAVVVEAPAEPEPELEPEPAQDAPEPEPEPAPVSASTKEPCGAPSPYEQDSAPCSRVSGHRGNHQNSDRESW